MTLARLNPLADQEGAAGMQHRVRRNTKLNIGVVLFLNHEVSQEDLMKRADSVMYRAKEAGRNAIQFYRLTQ